MSEWLEFEKLATRIYKELAPHACVTHDDRIVGQNTGIERRIDVSIRATVVGHELLIVVQARNRARPADVNDVGEFASVVKDVRASKGILICNAGFTRGAVDYARNLGIDLCSLHDAQSRDWSLDIKLPLLWIELSPKVHIQCECYLEEGDSISENPREWVFSADEGKTRLLIFETFERKWNAGELDRVCDRVHTIVPEQTGITLRVDKGAWRPVTSLILQYIVERKAWLGYFSPSECRGILDRIDDAFTASYLNIDDIPMRREESWTSIKDPDGLAVIPKGTLVTTTHWQISADGMTYYDVYSKPIEQDGAGHQS